MEQVTTVTDSRECRSTDPTGSGSGGADLTDCRHAPSEWTMVNEC